MKSLNCGKQPNEPSQVSSKRGSTIYQNIFFHRPSNTIHLWDDTLGYQAFPYKPYAYVKDPNGQYTSVYGDKLSKITRWEKSDELVGKLLESDVSPTTRTLIDLYGDSDEVSEHRELFLDIETSMEPDIPDPWLPTNEITSIAMYDRLMDEFQVLIVDKENRLADRKKGNIDIVTFPTERDMLLSFIDRYQAIAPTMLVHYNGDYFDIPYLYNRIQSVLSRRDGYKLSPIGIVNVLEMHTTKLVSIAGVTSADYLQLYKKFTQSERSSYSLDAVSTAELGRGKIKYKGTLDDLYRDDVETFIDYNVNDVVLIVDLEKKLKFLELLKSMCHKGHVAYQEIYYSSAYVEGAILTYLRRKGLVAPNKQPKQEHEQIEGAYVKLPAPGLYEWVYDLDIRSLYPSVIMTLNISPETKVMKINGGWSWQEYMDGTVDDKTYEIIQYEKGRPTAEGKATGAQIRSILASTKCSVSANGCVYDMSHKGVVPEILEVWFDERDTYKKLMQKHGLEGDKVLYEYYDQRQLTQKILLNTVYGVLNLPTFRFYDRDNGEAVTTTGKAVSMYGQKKGSEFYNNEIGDSKDYVIYSDTDSAFFSAEPLVVHRHPEVDTEDEEIMSKYILQVCKEVQNYINDSYTVLAKQALNVDTHKFFIKQELIAKVGFWKQSKKRYALWVVNKEGVPVTNDEDKLDVKGMDVIRSDFPPAYRTVVRKVIVDILTKVPKLQIDTDVLNLKNTIPSMNVLEIANPKGVRKIKDYTAGLDGKMRVPAKGTPAHIRAAICYNNLIDLFGLNKRYPYVKDGEKIKWVYLKRNPFGFSTLCCKGEDDPEEIMEVINRYIDHRTMYQKTLRTKVEDIYNALGWEYPNDTSSVITQFFS